MNILSSVDRNVKVEVEGVASSKGYSCSKQLLSAQEFETRNVKLILRKCGCGSSWCPSCFKNGSKKRMMERLKLFDWRRTRHVMLSIDRDLFKDGKEAYEYVEDRGLIKNLVWNLRRTVGLMVIDWMWVREWHKDGFPHWHVFIEVEKEGKGGMIGQEILHKYWPWGRWVTEKPIYDEGHWKSLIGYFNKHGYFGKKGVQGELPEWAKDYDRKIRRYGAMILPSSSDDKDKIKKEVRWRMKERAERKTYRMLLSQCGENTRMVVENDCVKIDRVVSVKYWELRRELDGAYVEGVGYLVEIDEGELVLLADKYRGLLGLVAEIIEQEFNYYEFKDMIGGDDS